MKHFILAAALAFLPIATVLANPASQPPPRAAAAKAFAQAHKLCTADHGRMWGISLCGPMMFTAPKSGTAVLNQAVPGAKRDGAVWRITLPKGFPFANSTYQYKGKHWITIIWPILQKLDPTQRKVLLMHESYHRIQPELGLTSEGSATTNGHLATRAGRIWLRGELHALRAALSTHGSTRKQALQDALTMRVYRRSLFPHATEQERALELNEGLAQSTGIDAGLSTRQARIKATLQSIDRVEKQPSYVRSFAYATGPAYGELLDAAEPNWRRRVTPDFDFGKATAKAYGIAMPGADKKAAARALDRHGGEQIVAQEDRRAHERKARQQRYKKEFAGRTVSFPIIHSQRTFDPRKVMHFADHGNIYTTLQVNDAWGELHVNGADALLSADTGTIVLPIKQHLSGQHLKGNGWSATIEAPYALAPDPQKSGSYVIVKDPASDK